MKQLAFFLIGMNLWIGIAVSAVAIPLSLCENETRVSAAFLFTFMIFAMPIATLILKLLFEAGKDFMVSKDFCKVGFYVSILSLYAGISFGLSGITFPSVL